MSIPPTDIFESMVTLFELEPSKMATSLVSGGVVVEVPPEEVDQLLFPVKDPPAGPIQYFIAAEAKFGRSKKKRLIIKSPEKIFLLERFISFRQLIIAFFIMITNFGIPTKK
jgi:hypothetical protein